MRAPAPPAHVRSIEVSAAEAVEPDGRPGIVVHGELIDRRPRGVPSWIRSEGEVIHHMVVTLVVSYPDYVIRAVEASMRTYPHAGFCAEAVPPLQSLVGVSVTRGFTRAVNERFGRERGCTHVVALVLAMGPVVRQGAGALFGFDTPAPLAGAAPEGVPGPREPRAPWFIDSCQAWRKGGPLHRAWVARQETREA